MTSSSVPAFTRDSSYTATYSPDDNKLRLYCVSRLPKDLYERVHAAGFRWASKQDLFVAPMWTPEREDVLLELCGDIGDEDQSLTERATMRAERFETYSDKRADEAQTAREAVSAITANIPLGQPILVGHHSERHARKDAQRIESGMRKAVQLWETSTYWTTRAAGALRHARYTERPDVRARRIRTIEADHRKWLRSRDESTRLLNLWLRLGTLEQIKTRDGGPTTLQQRALFLSDRDQANYGTWSELDRNQITPEQAQERLIEAHTRIIARAGRWIAHCENRLAYEKAMLGESGGIAADQTKPEKGGACVCWASHRGGWSYIEKVNRVTVSVLDNWGNGGRNFTRTIPFDKLSKLMSGAQVREKRELGLLAEFDDKTGFTLREGPPREPLVLDSSASVITSDVAATDPESTRDDAGPAQSFETLREQLAKGVQVISAPQLFPTPPQLAARIAQTACLTTGQRILEPSAGIGSLVREIAKLVDLKATTLVAVEVNRSLADSLQAAFPHVAVLCRDFLDISPQESAPFDRILMNPPFAKGQDVVHVEHALSLLAADGVLITIMSAGLTFRQDQRTQALRQRILELGGTIEVLPDDSFEDSGTAVRSVLVSIRATTQPECRQ
jgi:phospholipid N-methyltransferase